MRPGRRIHSTEEIAEAIRNGQGLKSNIADLLGMIVRGLELRLQKSSQLQEVMREVREAQLDVVESKLMQAAENGEAWAIRLYLKCHGKHRGWSERSTVNSPQQNSLARTIEQWNKLMNGEPGGAVKG